MVQAEQGKIRLFSDFFGGTSLTNTRDTESLGDFYAGGEGFEDSTAGIAPGGAELSGVVDLTSGATDADTSFIGTGVSLDVGLMGPIIMETRVQTSSVSAREFFFGLTSILENDEQLEDIVINSSSTVITLVADLVGFYFSSELTASATEWHGIHNGGSATGSATVSTVNLGSDDAVTTGEWQVLRLEVLLNGDARWYIDGVLLQTVVGAVSTTTDYAICLAAAANSGAASIIQVDYLLVDTNRDWTI